ncbi:MAG: DUF4244 domain-containing protein, partial [Actinomycetota bacterium]
MPPQEAERRKSLNRLIRRIRAEVGLAATWRREGGQTTAEYALVIFAAAAVAFLLINWA